MSDYQILQRIERIFEIRSIDIPHNRVEVGIVGEIKFSNIESCAFTTTLTKKLCAAKNKVRVTVEILE